MSQLAGVQYLSFVIGADEYAFEILESREVLQYPTVTAVPTLARAVRGVINLRGAAVPIVDLAAVFGQPAPEITKRTCVVVVETEVQPGQASLIGLVVDSVHQVFELRGDEIEPAPVLGNRRRATFIRGLGRLADGFVLLLDLPRILEYVDLDIDLEEVLEDLPLPDAEATREPELEAPYAGVDVSEPEDKELPGP